MCVQKRWVFSYFAWPPLTVFPFPYLHFPDVGNIGIFFFFKSELLREISLVTHMFLGLNVRDLIFTQMLRKVSQKAME